MVGHNNHKVKSSGRRPIRDDWAELLEVGNTFTHLLGKDYICSTEKYAEQIRSAASYRGVRTRIVIAEDKLSLRVFVERSTKKLLEKLDENIQKA